MTTTPAVRTENDALADVLTGMSQPDELIPGNIYGYKMADRVEVVDLADRHLERPRRKKGVVRVEDIASFVHYYKKHSDTSSEVFVDLAAGTITAILDAHQATPDEDLNRDETARWGEHRLVLRLEETAAWKRWVGIDRRMLRQTEFAEFIDDNRADIRVPSAAEMLELVQHFQAVTKVTFNSATILANGNRRLVFTEETDAGAGAKGQIEVPSTLELGIAPFTDSEPYVVNARFRYRIQGGVLSMGVLLDNADDVRRDAVSTVTTRLQDELGIQVMRGTPSS